MKNFQAQKIAAILLIVLCFSTSCLSLKSKPEHSLEEANALSHKANKLFEEGRYKEAIPYAEQSLEIREAISGQDQSDVAKSLNDLARLYCKTGRYAEAEPLYERSLEIREKTLGKDHPNVATSLNNLAALYDDTGRYAEAEPLYKRSLEIMEKALGKDHPDVAESLSELAWLYYETGRYAEAEPLYKRSWNIREKALGKDHPDVAKSLNGLALLYNETRRYAEAEPLYKKSLEIREKALGRNHPDVAMSLNNLAGLYHRIGRYPEVEPLYRRSLEINEKALGRDHPNVATSLSNLASLFKTVGRYAEAESLYMRSLEIYEKILGREHPDVATNFNNLASLYYETGRYSEAEPLYKRSLEIREKALGKDHPDVATSLRHLAMLYRTTGRYAEALPLNKKSFEIYAKALGKDHPDVATSLNDLALLCATAGRYAEAESLYLRSLEIYEKALGKDHPNVATSLRNLAALYRATGRYAEAVLLYMKSFEIYVKALGKDHPGVARCLNALAKLYYDSGRYSEAESLFKRSLEIFENALGTDHPDVATELRNLAAVYVNTGNHPESHRMLTRGNIIDEKEREDVFLLLSEKEKLNYLKQTDGSIHAFVAHAAQYMLRDILALRDTFDAWLRWKGNVTEAQGRYIDALTHSEDPEINKKFSDLTNIRREIAWLQLSGPEKMNLEGYKKRLEELEIKKGALEAELSRLSKDFALEKLVGKADTKGISEVLLRRGKDSVYIDFASTRTYDFKQHNWGKSIYLVFILLPDKGPVIKLINLSEAEKVDDHIKAYLEEMRKAKEYGEVPRERILKAEAKALYELLLTPHEPDIQNKKHLDISPDGNLNLIPFEVLMTPEGKYLMEDHLITYVAAGRDIMRFTDETQAIGEALIVADPDYDMGLREKVQVAKAMGLIETRGPASLSRDAKDMRFKRLPDTKQEADAIERCLNESKKINVKNYQDKKALEGVLFKAKNPSVLHLATHGYFLKDEEVKHQPQMMGLMSVEKERFVDPGTENPMLRSGIVLAGANASLKEGRDDGVVSAEKILGLRLKGTDLVVLSACETGVGDVKSGEGVFGLKRSFILSGAKTVVMSLWSIPSKETTELMTEFYTLMAKGKTKAEALREARLNLMKKNPNPFYWGAFIMVGNPN